MIDNRPVEMQGGNLYVGLPMEKWRPFYDGQYFQPMNEAETERRRALVDVANDDDSEALYHTSISDYQDWVELDWKAEHGTYDAFERFRKGFVGEHAELEVEMHKSARDWFRYDKLTSENRLAAASELGDVLWFIVAQASNCGCSVDTAYKQYLHRQWMTVKPDDDINILAIDYAAASENLPIIDSSRDCIHPDFYEEMSEGDDLLSQLWFRGAYVSLGADRAFGYNDPDEYLTQSAINTYINEIVRPNLGIAVASIAVFASKHLDISLTEVIRINIKKISARAESGRLDKDNGPRVGDEL